MSDSLPESSLKVLADAGSGRVFIILFDDEGYRSLAHAIAAQLVEKVRAVVVSSPPVDARSWEPLSESLSSLIQSLSIRQASFIGLGAGATLAQNISLVYPKVVRTLAVVDSTSRPHPTRWERLVDRLEARLPFGLPLRLGNRGFNVRSYLHRLRCPLLVVSTSRASSFIRAELDSLAALAPTAWHVNVTEDDPAREAISLSSTLLAFYDTPAKCPQKNIGVAV